MDIEKCIVGAASCVTYSQPYPVFSDCDFSGGSDLALDWMYAILPVLAVLWGLKKLASFFGSNLKEET